MKKSIIVLLFLLIISECYAGNENSFTLKIGKAPSQIGYSDETGYNIGPIALTEYNGNIYILDEVNLRINIYSAKGTYIKSYQLPKDHGFYYDLAVNPRGDILVLVNSGIYTLIGNNKLQKLFDLPKNVSAPCYISTDSNGNILFSGLNKPGGPVGMTSGIYYTNEKFTELEGYDIVSSNKGLVGVKTPENKFTIYNSQRELCGSINIPSDMIVPFGLTDNMDVYCAEITTETTKIYKFSKDGKSISKEINFSSSLIGDDSDVIRAFQLTKNGEIICLDVNEERCKILIIQL